LVGHYFNLLPFLVVALMLVQTKLFSPPATTPEMEQQQKMMKYMMIFMAFMFYKVPSGLGIYFITSSLWQISERLLLPKAKAPAPTAGGAGDGGSSGPGGPGGGGGGKKGGPGGGIGAPAKPQGKIAQFFGKVLEEASKNPTYRNLTSTETERERDRDKDRDRDRDRDRGKPRARPGRRR
jgi:YidC/Oxa1 family membrane protein insertase